MRTLIGFLVLVVAGCSGTGPAQPLADESIEEDAMPVDVGTSRELARFDAEGHAVEIHELSPGSLLIVERGKLGDPSRLERLIGATSLSDLYSRFAEGPVPQSLLEFEGRLPPHGGTELPDPDQDTGAPPPPKPAGGTPGPRLMHESGSAHFGSAHCPDEPASGTLSIGTDPVTVRQFCWASGYTNSYTESASAAVSTHEIGAASGNICYTVKDDETSRSYEIASGEYLRVWRSNERIWYDVPCPSGAVCSGVTMPRVATMSGAVGCASGDTWRFGGGFWKPDPDIYTPQ